MHGGSLQYPPHGTLFFGAKRPSMFIMVRCPVFRHHKRDLPQFCSPHGRKRSIGSDVQVHQIRHVALYPEFIDETHVSPFCSPSPRSPVLDVNHPRIWPIRAHIAVARTWACTHCYRCRPSVQHRPFYFGRYGFDVSAYKVPQLGMHLVRVPTGQMKHAHAARWVQFLRPTNS